MPNKNNNINDIAEDIDDILEDTTEIAEDTDSILLRIDSNIKNQTEIIKGLKKTWLGILFIVLLWLVDKVYVWLCTHGII